MHDVFLTTRLLSRVVKWDKLSQIEVDALQGVIRDFGFDAVFGNSACVVSNRLCSGGGDLVRIEFWMRIRMQYEHLSLEARRPGVFVLDT